MRQGWEEAGAGRAAELQEWKPLPFALSRLVHTERAVWGRNTNLLSPVDLARASGCSLKEAGCGLAPGRETPRPCPWLGQSARDGGRQDLPSPLLGKQAWLEVPPRFPPPEPAPRPAGEPVLLRKLSLDSGAVDTGHACLRERHFKDTLLF